LLLLVLLLEELVVELSKFLACPSHTSIAADSNKLEHMLDVNFVQEQRNGTAWLGDRHWLLLLLSAV
jgi:hypothetical protein